MSATLESTVRFCEPQGVWPKDPPPATDPQARELLTQAAAGNLALPRYAQIAERHGVPAIAPADGIHPHDALIAAVNETGITVVYQYAVWELALRDAPLEPGLNTATDLGLGALLRHEHAHVLWRALSHEEKFRFAERVPTDAGLIGQLTGYAADNFTTWYHGPEVDPLRERVQLRAVDETWCELFALWCLPEFDEQPWHEWIPGAAGVLADLLLA